VTFEHPPAPAKKSNRRSKRSRSPNHRLVKIHRNYTVEEAADLLGTHRNTVRRWIGAGLPVIDNRRPSLIHGLALRCYLTEKRAKSRRTCPPGTIYCVKCRSPQPPAGDMAEYIPLSISSGNLRGICPQCNILIHRRVNRGKIDLIRGQLDITFPVAESHIRDCADPSVNSDFD
jgi:hypothetical protein